jgi:leucyl aminopeptidase (aminopeptidase T)
MSDSPSSLERAAARSLVKNYLHVNPDENVIVEAWDHTLSMSSAMVDEVRRVGGSAYLAYESDDAWWRAVERKQAKPLGRLSDPEWAALAAADVYVQFWGPSDSARLEKLGEKRVEEWAEGWFDRWYKLARSTGLRGGRMAMGWVTDTRVRQWGVSKPRWMKALLEACLADPEEMAQSGHRLARAFTGTKKVRITHPNGTDLEVALAGVPARVYDGYPHPKDKAYSEFDMLANFPDGRLRMALDAKSAEGRFVSNRSSYDEVWFPWARYSRGVFDFSGGKLTSFSFEEGEAEFAKNYARGTPGKDRTGSLVIGLNPNLKNVPDQEDMERGSVQLTVGGNTYSGGSNASDFQGSIRLAGSEICLDGTPVVRAGKIL